MNNLYADRDHEQLGEHYVKHVAAMTAEGLHAKSDIAAELAYRDAEITRLRAELAAKDAECEKLKMVCGEVYQVIGFIWKHKEDEPMWSDDDLERVLDNLSDASNDNPISHDDLLPWPKQDTNTKENSNG